MLLPSSREGKSTHSNYLYSASPSPPFFKGEMSVGQRGYLYLRPQMRDFILKLIVFCVLIGILDFCWIRFMPLDKHVPHVWMMLAFFACVTSVFHWLTLHAAKGKPQAFIRYYMGSTALRMMLYIIAIVIYRFIDKPTVIPFALGFMAHYFLFTIFEVVLLLRQLKELK